MYSEIDKFKNEQIWKNAKEKSFFLQHVSKEESLEMWRNFEKFRDPVLGRFTWIVFLALGEKFFRCNRRKIGEKLDSLAVS